MPFFIARGRRILLIQGFRNHDGGVRHRRLHEFLTRTDLATTLNSGRWSEFEAEVAAKHPDLQFDWPRLREQAEQFADGIPTPAARDTDARTLELRKLIGRLRQSLNGLHLESGEGDRQVFMGAAYDLREMFYRESVQLHARLYPGEKSAREAVDILRPFYFRDRDGATVDEAERLFRDGHRKKAEKAFAQARLEDPLDPDVLNSEGICRMEEGELARAEALFREAADMARHQLPLKRRILQWGPLEVRPYLRARYNLGLVLEQQGRLEEAVAVWEEWLSVCPQDPFGVAQGLAGIYHRQGRLEAAVSYYQRALNDYSPDAHYSLAAALLEQGCIEDGIKRLLTAFRMNAYIPSLLLEEDPLPHEHLFHGMNTREPDWADEYVEAARDLWTDGSLLFLAALWHAPEVQEAVQEYRAVECGLKVEKDGKRRSELARAHTSGKRLLPGREAEDVVARVIAATGSTVTG